MGHNPLLHSDGQDYGTLFLSIRSRLIDLNIYRQSLDLTWSQLTFEGFAFKFRMLIEELSLFLRSALIERGQLPKSKINAYGSANILGPVRAEVTSLRFITARRFSKIVISDDEFRLHFEYEKFVSFSVDWMIEIYGKLGNYMHPTIKPFDQNRANSLIQDCYSFHDEYSGIFFRHSLERNISPSEKLPLNLDDFLFIIGTTDEGEEVFVRCGTGPWKEFQFIDGAVSGTQHKSGSLIPVA